jgi:hypothetical protein
MLGISTGAMAQTVPADPNTFLTFLEHFQAENSITSAAYYDAVDPQNKQLTAKAWAKNAGFIGDESTYVTIGSEAYPGDDEARANAYSFALYRNATDLGFVRRMFIRCVPADCATAVNPDIYTYVENYFYREGTWDPFSDGKSRTNRIATVAFNWTAAADGSNPGQKFGTIYTFNGNDDREPGGVPFAPSLDGRPAKENPGVCLTCHGGFPKALVNGVYPGNGRINGFKYLPFDLENFNYSDTPGLTRADQEDAFKRFNIAVLRTHPTGKSRDDQGVSRLAAGRELIQGWYGGAAMPGAFNSPNHFVPQGWREAANGGVAPAGSENLYLTTVAPACRACHSQQEPSLDFATERGFRNYKAAIKELVMKVECGVGTPTTPTVDDRKVMPLALLTFQRFWESLPQVNTLKAYLGIGPAFCRR